MTEAQWLESTDLQAMLVFLNGTGRLTDRKARLYACACCRRVWHLLDETGSRKVVEASERYADGAIKLSTLRRARSSASVSWMHDRPAAFAAYHTAVEQFASNITYIVSLTASAVAYAARSDRDEHYQKVVREELALLCDIAGPLPFRQVLIEASLLTTNNGLIANLAEAAYEHRSLPAGTLDPARLMILADAVEEVGGPDELVAHLRSPQSHVRGCWATDLLTGKS